MIKVNPQGQIYLCKTPLESDYKHQLTFTSKANQSAYFTSTVVRTYDNNTYINKDGGVKINCNAEEIRTCNYMFYRNTGFDNRIYYCFITSIEYLSENSTLVRFETDCFQTWYFDLVYKPCFVEREHVNDDTIGLHTIDEGLETGEYMINETQHFDLNLDFTPDPLIGDNYYVCFVVTEPPDPNDPTPIVPTTGYDIGTVFTPLIYFAVRSNNGFEQARKIIDWYKDSHETLDKAIINMYMIPYSCVDTSVSQTWTKDGQSITVYAVKSSYRGLNTNPCRENTTMSGLFVPHNKKLYCYPYCYLYLDNKNGGTSVYRWEDAQLVNVAEQGETPQYRRQYSFYTSIVPSTSLSAKLYPLSYKGKTESSSYYGLWNYGLNFGKVPVCAWTNDYYTNWLTQNGVNMASSVMTSTTSGAISGGLYGGAIGALVGGATSGLMSVIGNIAKNHEASVVPPQANGDVNNGDATFAYTFNNITAYHMTIRKEMAEIIDKFFDMYGYKVNIVKTPSITGRTYWNYVKTIDCNIEGDVPQEDLLTIRNIFNNGCTFWHSATNMYNYNLINDIV